LAERSSYSWSIVGIVLYGGNGWLRDWQGLAEWAQDCSGTDRRAVYGVGVGMSVRTGEPCGVKRRMSSINKKAVVVKLLIL
jgi:hypothetical protein